MVEDMHQLMNGSIQHLSKGGNKILVINYRQITSGDSQMHASQHDISVLSSSSLFLGKESMALSRLHHHGFPEQLTVPFGALAIPPEVLRCQFLSKRIMWRMQHEMEWKVDVLLLAKEVYGALRTSESS